MQAFRWCGARAACVEGAWACSLEGLAQRLRPLKEYWWRLGERVDYNWQLNAVLRSWRILENHAGAHHVCLLLCWNQQD